jgi:quercetin dioxygenase-like cupin family protein
MGSSQYRLEKWQGAQAPDVTTIQQAMIDEGYRVYQWTDHPGANYGSHSHDNYQSRWIVSGTLELNVDGFGRLTLGAGDRDFMPAGTHHSARVVGDEPVTCLIGERLG